MTLKQKFETWYEQIRMWWDQHYVPSRFRNMVRRANAEIDSIILATPPLRYDHPTIEQEKFLMLLQNKIFIYLHDLRLDPKYPGSFFYKFEVEVSTKQVTCYRYFDLIVNVTVMYFNDKSQFVMSPRQYTPLIEGTTRYMLKQSVPHKRRTEQC